MSDKGLTSKIYRQLPQLNIRQPDLKIGRRPEESFLQRWHTGGQQANEKMLNITNY